MRPSAYPRVLRGACLLALAALGLMAWSLLDPRPVPVMVALSAGQALGAASLAAFAVVVAADLRRARPDRPDRPPGGGAGP